MLSTNHRTNTLERVLYATVLHWQGDQLYLSGRIIFDLEHKTQSQKIWILALVLSQNFLYRIEQVTLPLTGSILPSVK